MRIADRIGRVDPSGIRRFFELAEEYDDIISLGVGEPDFTVPWAARAAAIDSLEQGRTAYTTNRGLRSLREAIAGHVADRYDLTYDPAEGVLVTTGVSEGLDLAIRALVNPGESVGVVEPAYVSYTPGVVFADATPIRIKTSENDEFKLTVEALEAAGAEAATVLLLCYPNNPTGAIMTRSDLEPIARFCREHDVTVISDEIYADLTYTSEHVSIASLPGMAERTIVLNGFSKAYAMTGLRLGYAMGPADGIAAMNRIHQYTMLSSPTTAQYAAIEALDSCWSEVIEMRRDYDRRRRFVLARFSEMGLSCFEAEGAFYAFPACPSDDDEAFAKDLLTEQRVAVVPGSAFGHGGRGHVRVSYATGFSELREAMDRIEAFVRPRISGRVR